MPPLPVAGTASGQGSVPLFSIVIATYQAAVWLPRSLESVFAQSFTDREIVVVDDGSTDGTTALLARYGDALRVFSVAHGGVSNARNVGTERALGTYVVFLDADDLLFPWALQRYADAIAMHGSPALVMSRPLYFTDEADLDANTDVTSQSRRWDDYLASVYEGHRVSIASAIRRDVLLASGGFRPTPSAEDHDLYLRLGVEAGFVYLREPPVYGYLQHAQSASHDAAVVRDGIRFLLREERAGRYPGGRVRAPERRHVLAGLVAWAIPRCLDAGGWGAAVELYGRGLPLLLTTRRRRFVVPLARKLVRRAWRARPSGRARRRARLAP